MINIHATGADLIVKATTVDGVLSTLDCASLTFQVNTEVIPQYTYFKGNTVGYAQGKALVSGSFALNSTQPVNFEGADLKLLFTPRFTGGLSRIVDLLSIRVTGTQMVTNSDGQPIQTAYQFIAWSMLTNYEAITTPFSEAVPVDQNEQLVVSQIPSNVYKVWNIVWTPPILTAGDPIYTITNVDNTSVQVQLPSDSWTDLTALLQHLSSTSQFANDDGETAPQQLIIQEIGQHTIWYVYEANSQGVLYKIIPTPFGGAAFNALANKLTL